MTVITFLSSSDTLQKIITKVIDNKIQLKESNSILDIRVVWIHDTCSEIFYLYRLRIIDQ
jgi:hypothetical protein